MEASLEEVETGYTSLHSYKVINSNKWKAFPNKRVSVNKSLTIEMWNTHKTDIRMSRAHKNARKWLCQRLSKTKPGAGGSSIIQTLVLILDELSWFWVIDYEANSSSNKLIFSLLFNLNFERCFPIVPLKDPDNLGPTFSKHTVLLILLIWNVIDGYIIFFLLPFSLPPFLPSFSSFFPFHSFI